MTANRGLFVRNNGAVGTTPIEGRLVLAALVAEQSPGVPRQGLLDQRATTVVSGHTNMSYNVAPCSPVLNRATNEGVYLFTLTGTTNVATTAAPGTGSRWDLIYVKQNDLDKGDATNTAVLAVLQGTASTGTPTKPTASLPAGAYVLAEALVSAGATSTSGAQVTITQTWRYTALRGAPIPVRNTTERNELTSPQVFTTVRRLDLGPTAIETYTGSTWELSGVVQFAEFTGPAIDSDPGAGKDWGTMTPAASRTFNNDFVAPRGGGGLTFTKNGAYSIQGLWLPSSDPGNISLGIHKNGSGTPIGYISRTGTYGNWECTVSVASHYFAAGEWINIIVANSSGSVFGSNVTVAKLS